MRRKAIIIGGNDNNNDAPSCGVVADVTAWERFLHASLGGAWLNSEIVTILDPSRAEVLDAIRLAGDSDFALVTFSGHGYVTKDNYGFTETRLYLSGNEEISERDMNTGSHWCLAIFDCCRRFDIEAPPIDVNFANEALTSTGANVARQIYENAIERCEKGYVKVYSAGLHQMAQDEDSFTRAMIDCAKENIDRKQDGILRINEAVELAKRKLTRQQVPEYRGGRRLGHLPFAIKV